MKSFLCLERAPFFILAASVCWRLELLRLTVCTGSGSSVLFLLVYLQLLLLLLIDNFDWHHRWSPPDEGNLIGHRSIVISSSLHFALVLGFLAWQMIYNVTLPRPKRGTKEDEKKQCLSLQCELHYKHMYVFLVATKSIIDRNQGSHWQRLLSASHQEDKLTIQQEVTFKIDRSPARRQLTLWNILNFIYKNNIIVTSTCNATQVCSSCGSSFASHKRVAMTQHKGCLKQYVSWLRFQTPRNKKRVNNDDELAKRIHQIKRIIAETPAACGRALLNCNPLPVQFNLKYPHDPYRFRAAERGRQEYSNESLAIECLHSGPIKTDTGY